MRRPSLSTGFHVIHNMMYQMSCHFILQKALRSRLYFPLLHEYGECPVSIGYAHRSKEGPDIRLCVLMRLPERIISGLKMLEYSPKFVRLIRILKPGSGSEHSRTEACWRHRLSFFWAYLHPRVAVAILRSFCQPTALLDPSLQRPDRLVQRGRYLIVSTWRTVTHHRVCTTGKDSG